MKAFNTHKYNAVKNRGVGFELSFGEWMWYWLDSGKLDQRGSKAGQYQMARRGPDIGPYKRGNVDIKLRESNLAEADYSASWPQERRDMMSALYAGTTKSDETKERMRKSAIKRMAHTSLPSRNKAVMAEGQQYVSVTEAGKALGVERTTVLNRIKRGWEGYSWVLFK